MRLPYATDRGAVILRTMPTMDSRTIIVSTLEARYRAECIRKIMRARYRSQPWAGHSESRREARAQLRKYANTGNIHGPWREGEE